MLKIDTITDTSCLLVYLCAGVYTATPFAIFCAGQHSLHLANKPRCTPVHGPAPVTEVVPVLAFVGYLQ